MRNCHRTCDGWEEDADDEGEGGGEVHGDLAAWRPAPQVVLSFHLAVGQDSPLVVVLGPAPHGPPTRL